MSSAPVADSEAQHHIESIEALWCYTRSRVLSCWSRPSSASERGPCGYQAVTCKCSHHLECVGREGVVLLVGFTPYTPYIGAGRSGAAKHTEFLSFTRLEVNF